MSPYDLHLDRNAANYAVLTPISFLAWAAEVYPDRLSGIHGHRRFTWRETYARCRRLASALRTLGVERNSTVALMLANTPEMYEAHFGIPMAGGVINTLNPSCSNTARPASSSPTACTRPSSPPPSRRSKPRSR